MANEPAPPTSFESEIYADRDVWQISESFNVHIDATQKTPDLLVALTNNRSRLEPLKKEYAGLVEEDGGIKSQASRRRRTVYKELNRIYGAMEAIKTEVRRRGADFEIDEWDEEHPTAAYRRLRTQPKPSCYVVTAVYGRDSKELRQVKRVCLRRFALNPLLMPSWILYKLLGQVLARFAQKNLRATGIMNKLIARPIVLAARKEMRRAIPWLIYLGLYGWSVVGIIILLCIVVWPQI